MLMNQSLKINITEYLTATFFLFPEERTVGIQKNYL